MAARLSKEQSIEKRVTAWALRAKGWTELRIAAQLGVNQSTISRWLKAIAERTLRDLDEQARTELVVMLGQLQHAADELMQAWERSKAPKKRAGKRSKPTFDVSGKPGHPEEVTTSEVIERDGEAVYLLAYQSTLDRIVKLLALEDRMARPDDDDRGMSLAAALALAESVNAGYTQPALPAPGDITGPDADDSGVHRWEAEGGK